MKEDEIIVNEILEKVRRGEINFAKKSSTKVLSKKELEVLKNNSVLWISIDNNVYDIGGWVEKHPGGSLIICHFLYRDATDQFDRYHTQDIKNRFLPGLQIGVLEEPLKIESLMMKEFREIEKKLYQEGLFITNYYFYLREMIKALFTIIIGILIVINGPPTYLNYFIAALFIAFCWHQLSFVAHDSGHNAVTHVMMLDNYYGMFLASCFSGLSIGWWKDTHNIHHMVTNDPHHDPDIQLLPFLAVSEKFIEGVHSTYHNKEFKIDNFRSRFLISIQHILYYVIMLFGRLNLSVQGVLFLCFNERAKFRKIELFAMLIFTIWFSYVVSYIPTWNQRVFFVLVANFSTFLLHIQITISHYAMNTDFMSPDEDFVNHQLRTSMDVNCNSSLDWLHGGLQFQVIHHLFPRLPRHNLRKVRERMIPFFKKHNLTYHCYDFIFGNMMVLTHLKLIATKLGDFIFHNKKIS